MTAGQTTGRQNPQQNPEPVPRRKYPCAECPAVVANAGRPASMFPAERWEALRKTVIDPATGGNPLPWAPMFGCHMGVPGSPDEDLACAGWLAICGYRHTAVRIAVTDGRLPASVLKPGAGWPQLHGSWEEMEAIHTIRPGRSGEADVRADV